MPTSKKTASKTPAAKAPASKQAPKRTSKPVERAQSAQAPSPTANLPDAPVSSVGPVDSVGIGAPHPVTG